MKTVILTADLGGNIPPTLAVAAELAHRGATVELAGLGEGRTPLARVPFGPAEAILPTGDRRRGSREFVALMRLMGGRGTSRRTAELIAARRPDVVVVDCMTPAVLHGALATGCPVVVLFHTFGAFWIEEFDRGAMGRTLGLVGMRPSTLWARADARLLLTDAELDPGRTDPALSGFIWTGSTEVGLAGPPEPRERPRVLVSLSATDWPGMLPVYRRIVTALQDLPVDAVVTTGGAPLGGELRGAPNVTVQGWVPHATLLPTVELLVGHGGHSTTMRALAHGIPVLVLPINPTADQQRIGKILHGAGLGAVLPKNADPARIRDTIHGLLSDQGVRDTARRTGERLRAARPGAEVAAERIARTAPR